LNEVKYVLARDYVVREKIVNVQELKKAVPGLTYRELFGILHTMEAREVGNLIYFYGAR